MPSLRFNHALAAFILSAAISTAAFAQTLNQFGTIDPIDAPFLGIQNFAPGTPDPRLLPPAPTTAPTPGAPLPQPEPPAIVKARVQTVDKVERVEVQIKDLDEWIPLGSISTLPIGTKIFTWAPIEDAERWDRQNFVDDGEMKWLTENGSGAAGGGFYASLSPVDSNGFGEFLIEQSVRKPVRMLAMNLGVHATPELIKMLRTAGIDLIRYTQTWMNWIRNPDLALGDAKTVREFSEIKPVLEQTRTTRPDLVHNGYAHIFTVLIKLSKNLDPKSISYLGELESLGFKRSYFEQGLRLPSLETKYTTNPHWHRILTEMLPYIEPLIKKYMQETKVAFAKPFDKEAFQKVASDPMLNWNKIPFAQLCSNFTYAGSDEIRLILETGFHLPLVANARLSPSIQWVGVGPTPPAPKPLPFPDPYLLSLNQGLEVIDTPDYALGMAQGRSDLWTLYDEPGAKTPLTKKWLDAVSSVNAFDPFATNPIPKQKTTLEKLTGVVDILSDGAIKSVRTEDIWAGGDLYPDWKGGYYRVSAQELEVLQQNVFITVESKPDPESRDASNVLARHRYTSVQDYSRFLTVISPELADQLKAAELAGKLNQANTEEYRQLTQKFLEALITALMPSQLILTPNSTLPIAAIYRALISIHPFKDFNGRSVRAFMKGLAFNGILLVDFNHDLTKPLASLAIEINNGTRAFNFIFDAFQNEQYRNPQFPQYYNTPEFYQFLTGTAEIKGDPKEFVRLIKNYLLQPSTQELIRQKRFNELRYPGVCDLQLTRPQK